MQGLDSFPSGALNGRTHRTTFDTNDQRWGGALSCDAATASFAALQPPAGFGQQGGLAVALWIKLPVMGNTAMPSSSTTAGGLGGQQAGFQYVLSMAQAGTTGSSSTNQVCIGCRHPGMPLACVHLFVLCLIPPAGLSCRIVGHGHING